MYYNLLSQIKNAALAKRKSFILPFSGFDLAIAKILVDAGYLESAEKRVTGKKKFIDVVIAYKNSAPVFSDFKLISKPSRHLYRSYRDMGSIRSGFGIGIVSTSKGVMRIEDAKKNKVGGEYLFEIW